VWVWGRLTPERDHILANPIVMSPPFFKGGLRGDRSRHTGDTKLASIAMRFRYRVHPDAPGRGQGRVAPQFVSLPRASQFGLERLVGEGYQHPISSPYSCRR
jgi:hypothetical protein